MKAERFNYEMAAIHAELLSANQVFGENFATLHEAYAVIKEEVDEFWDLVKQNPNKMTASERAKWIKSLRKELTQVAAMTIKAIGKVDAYK